MVHERINFLDEETSYVYAYELTEGKMISRLSTLTTEWEEIKNDASAPYLYAHHHCGFYHPAKKKLLIFGGYGNRSYSDMFLSYDMSMEVKGMSRVIKTSDSNISMICIR